MKRIRRSTVLVAVVVLALGALSAPAFAKTDKQIAKASTLRVTDLTGTGWSGSPHKEDPPSKLPSCAPTNKVDAAGKQYSAHSPDFDNATAGTTITNTVYVYPTVKQAKTYLAAFKLPTALECLQQGLDENVQDTPGASAEVGTIDVSGGPFNDGVGFAGVVRGVPGGANGATQDIYLQAVAFRVGRAVTGFTTTNPGEAYPDTEQVVVKQIKRLKQNLK